MAERDLHDVLLDTLRGAKTRAPAVTGGEWREVARLATHYQLAPLLHSAVNGRVGLGLPTDALDALRQAHRATAAGNLAVFHGLGVILRALAARGIPTIVLKGGYLAAAAYDHIALRPMRDVDIMVRTTDLRPALECLIAAGYPCDDIDAALAGCATAAHVEPLTKPNAPAVELHWNIEGPDSPFAVDLDGLWARARPARIAGVDALTPGPEDFLLHLCLHAARHLTRDWDDCTVLKGVCDLSRAVAHWASAVNWPTLAARAFAWRARNPVYVMLHLASEWFGAAVPESVMTALRPIDLTDEHLRWLRERILGGRPDSVPISDHAAELVTAARFREKVAVLWREAFPGRRRLARDLDLPERSWRIYTSYPRYLVSRIARGARLAWHSLTRRDDLTFPAHQAAQNIKLRAWLQASC
jgi:hypothetical protein